jgi:hypothetical protein
MSTPFSAGEDQRGNRRIEKRERERAERRGRMIN